MPGPILGNLCWEASLSIRNNNFTVLSIYNSIIIKLLIIKHYNFYSIYGSMYYENQIKKIYNPLTMKRQFTLFEL